MRMQMQVRMGARMMLWTMTRDGCGWRLLLRRQKPLAGTRRGMTGHRDAAGTGRGQNYAAAAMRRRWCWFLAPLAEVAAAWPGEGKGRAYLPCKRCLCLSMPHLSARGDYLRKKEVRWRGWRAEERWARGTMRRKSDMTELRPAAPHRSLESPQPHQIIAG